MKRREFIFKSALGTAGLSTIGSLPLFSFNDAKYKHITILHTNDTHSHIDPFPANDPKNPNMGGVARRAEIINKIRRENPNTLLLDAGDAFQGTPYFNYYGGELEFKLMSMLKYDAGTFGNHEFDNGLSGLLAQLPHAKFDFLTANYDFTNTILEGKTKPYKIFYVDGVKIGVFGLGVQLEGLVNKSMYLETKYLDPTETSQEMTRVLKQKEKCDIVICLSHLGYDYKNDPNKISDLKLAKATKDIDLIIGGHTHTFLDKPTEVKNLDNEIVLVNQVGCYGINIGKIDFYLTNDKKLIKQGRSIEV